MLLPVIMTAFKELFIITSFSFHCVDRLRATKKQVQVNILWGKKNTNYKQGQKKDAALELEIRGLF